MAEMAAKEKKKREKLRWGTLSTTLWFLKRGWRTKKRVPILIAAMVILRIARSLFELFLPPVTVEKAAGGAPLPDLFAAVGILAGGLLLTNAVLRYIQNNMLFPKIGIRGKIVSDIADKMATTSFPNAVLDTGFERLRSRASNAVGGNSQPGEATWGTLEELAVSLIGFAVYLDMLDFLPGGEEECDIDVMLLYDENEKPSDVQRAVAALRAQGKRVLAAREEQKKYRYKQLAKLKDGEVSFLEENA